MREELLAYEPDQIAALSSNEKAALLVNICSYEGDFDELDQVEEMEALPAIKERIAAIFLKALMTLLFTSLKNSFTSLIY